MGAVCAAPARGKAVAREQGRGGRGRRVGQGGRGRGRGRGGALDTAWQGVNRRGHARVHCMRALDTRFIVNIVVRVSCAPHVAPVADKLEARRRRRSRAEAARPCARLRVRGALLHLACSRGARAGQRPAVSLLSQAQQYGKMTGHGEAGEAAPGLLNLGAPPPADLLPFFAALRRSRASGTAARDATCRLIECVAARVERGSAGFSGRASLPPRTRRTVAAASRAHDAPLPPPPAASRSHKPWNAEAGGRRRPRTEPSA